MAAMGCRGAFVFLLLVQFLYFGGVFIRGKVIFPHNNDIELGVRAEEDGNVSNRKFSDQSSVYIPEINQHLNGNHAGWISTWNPYVQLGRPTGQFSGLGKAWIVSHLLSFFTSNPFVFYTVLTVLTVYFTGIFFFLFLRSLGLHPLACATAAAGLSTGAYVSYWLTFAIFLSTICWTVCLLWLIEGFVARRSYARALGISFAAYSLLMTGYPQFIILNIYLLAGFAVIRLWGSGRSRPEKFFDGIWLAASAVSGLAMASPVISDLAVAALNSARLSASDAFFAGILPGTESAMDFFIYAGQIFDAFWAGNPVRPDYPFVFNGISFTPLYFGLLLMSFAIRRWRILLAWQLFIFFCLLLTVWPAAYLFAVRHMGFHLSPMHILGGALIPGFVLCGYALNDILKNRISRKLSSLLFAALLLVMSAVWYSQYEKVHAGYIIAGCCMLFGIFLFTIRPLPVFLPVMVVCSVMLYGHSMMLLRPLEVIHTGSPIVEKLEAELKGVYRYAKVGNVNVLPPNQESLFMIKSIFSYDSLSSVNYQKLVLKLSDAGTSAYGRHFKTIDNDSKLGEEALSFTGVSCVLSRENLDNNLFKKTGVINGISFYKKDPLPVLEAQIVDYTIGKSDQDVDLCGFLNNCERLKINQIVSFDDLKHFRVTACPEKTVLFLSQQYHPQWKARAKKKNLDTVRINGFYQGVILPPQTDEVILEFRPMVLFSWIPQLLYLLLGSGLLCRYLIKRAGDTGRGKKI